MPRLEGATLADLPILRRIADESAPDGWMSPMRHAWEILRVHRWLNGDPR